MHLSLSDFKANVREHLQSLVLLGAVLTSFVSIPFLAFPSALPEDTPFETSEGTVLNEPALKLSEIRDARIDTAAASIILSDAGEAHTLPVALWTFLLVAFVALLAFNLGYGLWKRLPLQWGWESVYALLFLLGWFVWDESRQAIWFPFLLLETGLIVYAIYLSFWERRHSEPATLFN